MNETQRVGRIGLTQIQRRAVRENDLLVWTIYDHPKDFPSAYVVRPHSTRLAGPLTVHFEHHQLDTVRRVLVHLGLTCLGRNPGDDPVILETWV